MPKLVLYAVAKRSSSGRPLRQLSFFLNEASESSSFDLTKALSPRSVLSHSGATPVHRSPRRVNSAMRSPRRFREVARKSHSILSFSGGSSASLDVKQVPSPTVSASSGLGTHSSIQSGRQSVGVGGAEADDGISYEGGVRYCCACVYLSDWV